MLQVLSTREKIILAFTILVIVFSVLFNLLFSPLLAKNAELSGQIKIAEARIRKGYRLLSQKEALLKRFNSLPEAIKRTLSGEDTSVGILSEIERVAKASLLRIIDIRPQTGEGGLSSKKTVIWLKTEGNIENYLKFIYDIENSLSFLKISEFQLSSQGGKQALEGTFLISEAASSEVIKD